MDQKKFCKKLRHSMLKFDLKSHFKELFIFENGPKIFYKKLSHRMLKLGFKDHFCEPFIFENRPKKILQETSP